MPGNENPFTLNEQTQVLKDIRDSIRHQGSVSAGMPLASGRPTPQFIATQQSLDRMVAGQWATMGWADAYQTPIRTSLANDLMGVLGLRAAPQSMWQREYELFAGGMLQNRLSSFPADIIMPGFGRRSREMGAAMYQMSSRFNRAGDNR